MHFDDAKLVFPLYWIVTIINVCVTIIIAWLNYITENSYICIMQTETHNFEKVADYCNLIGAECQHPLVAVVDSEKTSIEHPRELKARWGVFGLFLKRTKGCTINYGRTSYDYDDQSVVCIGPGQLTHSVSSSDDITPSFRALVFHPDLLYRTSLARKIREYTFFGYDSHEALHLSPHERATIEECFDRIANELSHPIDRYSKNLIVSNIELLLEYCMRYYSRQFTVREVINDGLMARFNDLLDRFFQDPDEYGRGLPNVKYFADKMSLSANYFGDLVKRESGVTAQEYIHRSMLSRAKMLLLDETSNVSQTAYSLGFQYPQHFIRFFKRKTGQTPREYINAN